MTNKSIMISPENSLGVIKNLIKQKLYFVATSYGQCICAFGIETFEILEEMAFAYYYSERYKQALDIATRIERNCTDENLLSRTCNNKKFYLKGCNDEEKNKTKHTIEHPVLFPFVTFTMTSCKRLDLFIQTMDEFLKNCLDKHLIYKWIVVDDNSSEKDRQIMKNRYPFIDYKFKIASEKGHVQSMQYIAKNVVSPYVIHIEDDRKLIDPRTYISDMISILISNKTIGQIAFNHNYTETIDSDITGGEFATVNQMRIIPYYIHEYCPTLAEKEEFNKRHRIDSSQNVFTVNYYPHFTLSASMISVGILKQIPFKDEVCFEFNYGLRYSNAGYKTAFLPGFHIQHIGRLTCEMNNPTAELNAYDLQNIKQFKEPVKYKTWIINLDRRQDRWNKILSMQQFLFPYERFSGIDGQKLALNDRLASVFKHNDFGMNAGFVGCALSHLMLWIRLLYDKHYDGYLICEDDILVDDKTFPKIHRIFNICQQPDVIFFCTTLRDYSSRPDFQEILNPKTYEETRFSIGGLGMYFISKKAAQILVDYIEENGIIHGIDIVLFKLADRLNMFFVQPNILEQTGDLISDVQINFDKKSHLVFNPSGIPDKPKLFNGEKIDFFENLIFK